VEATGPLEQQRDSDAVSKRRRFEQTICETSLDGKNKLLLSLPIDPNGQLYTPLHQIDTTLAKLIYASSVILTTVPKASKNTKDGEGGMDFF